jgi:UDP-2,3-diacylglucosamine pyrophosphatase LpxH
METTLIISDIHLGACNSEGEALIALLQGQFDRLVLNGDTVDHLNFRRFRPVDWEVIEQLQAVSCERELVVIRGNHDARCHSDGDAGQLDLLGRLLDVEVREEYSLQVGRRNYLVLHGDQFDDSMNLTRLGNMADSCYRTLQRLNRPAAKWAKHAVKRWSGAAVQVPQRAIAYARHHGYAGVIVGHTHFSGDEFLDGTHYLNTGCWVDWPCTYVAAEDGRIQLRSWANRKPVCDVLSKPSTHQEMQEALEFAGVH